MALVPHKRPLDRHSQLPSFPPPHNSEGFKIERPEDAAGVVAQALAHDGPVLVEALTDPFEPLMPGHIKPEQAEKLAQSLKKGEPNAGRIGTTIYRTALEDPNGNKQVLIEALQKEAPEIAAQSVKGE